jgi:hypothetical protein
MAERTPLAAEPLVAGATPTPWAEARQRLETPEQDRTYWLATMRPDGRPHVMPILGLWLDGAFAFITGEGTRKGKNLAHNPECVLTTSSQTLPALDLIVEGRARRVSDEVGLRRVADAYRAMMRWPLSVEDGAVAGPNAPTAGPPPYAVWELTPSTVYGLPGIAGTEDGEGQAGSFTPTRWRF